MRNRFDRQLDELNTRLVQMGRLCETAIKKATQALQNNALDMATDIIESDEDINRAEKAIETLCLRLLMEQQPVARDLRQISAALKMITDMERIGDWASDIAEIILSSGEVPSGDYPNVVKMSEAASKMVVEAVDAYVTRDLALAKKVQEEDDIVDELFDQNRNMLIARIKQTSGEEATGAVDLIMITKYLERIGDHAVNVAEWVEFSITGVHNGE
jgi:phosphate transport system protein